MTAIELRAELFREMNPAMKKVLAFVRSISPIVNESKHSTANTKLDIALSKFHKDWGGNKDAMEIADELRQDFEMTREVETW